MTKNLNGGLLQIIHEVLPFQYSLQVYSESFDQQLDIYAPSMLEHGAHSSKPGNQSRMQALLARCP